MGSAARELDGIVARTITEAGGRLMDRSVDGAGHSVVAFQLNGHEDSFHYAHSPRMNGCGPRNTKARLKRHLSKIGKLPPAAPQEPVEDDEEKRGPIVAPKVEPTPPKAERLSRKEMVKTFLSMSSLAEFMERFGLERAAAQTMILSSRGQSADKLRKELDRERAEAARRIRDTKKPPVEIKGPSERAIKRNRMIYTYCKYGLSFEEAADVFNMSVDSIKQIVRNKEKHGVR